MRRRVLISMNSVYNTIGVDRMKTNVLERRILEYLERKEDRNRRHLIPKGATIPEIGRYFEYPCSVTLHSILLRLQEKGLVRSVPTKTLYESWIITEKGKRYLNGRR